MTTKMVRDMQMEELRGVSLAHCHSKYTIILI